jgi:hypothetical protein
MTSQAGLSDERPAAANQVASARIYAAGDELAGLFHELESGENR